MQAWHSQLLGSLLFPYFLECRVSGILRRNCECDFSDRNNAIWAASAAQMRVWKIEYRFDFPYPIRWTGCAAYPARCAYLAAGSLMSIGRRMAVQSSLADALRPYRVKQKNPPFGRFFFQDFIELPICHRRLDFRGPVPLMAMRLEGRRVVRTVQGKNSPARLS